MPAKTNRLPASLLILCVGILAISVLFAVPATYTPIQQGGLTLLQFAVVGTAAWALGASELRSKSEERRKLAVAGTLLVLTWLLFAFLSGFGRPDQANAAQNQLRYLVLLADTVLIAGGLIMLTDSLRQAGERFYSVLGFAATVMATPVYLVWGAILVTAFAKILRSGGAELPPAYDPIMELSDVLLFCGGALTYVATAAFALAMGRLEWIGRRAMVAFAAASTVALAFLVVRGLAFPDPRVVFKHWYAIPGYIAGIPAVPWIMPMMFGVLLLRRVGR